MARAATVTRTTSESQVTVTVNLDGSGVADVATGVGFYDHMLTALAKHSLFDLTVRAAGDLHIDVHHTVEDTAIVLGQAVAQALTEKAGLTRYGEATVPLDEALARAVVDISGRPYVVVSGEPPQLAFTLIGGHFMGSLARHVFESFALNAGLTLHLTVLAGHDPHHIVEAEFKALARALRAAVTLDPRVVGVPSTKGSL
ncbi:MAG: imidazoleglycerol-phosphate dehydratase HisB [Bifidobacteriaceae bacterium]|nr:imidazoleglycerol-phosphate dehydratase HisB [Bifidobacteriaceae bacterium]